MSTTQHETELIEEVAVDVKELNANIANLVLYNDDHNFFEWVIQSLIEICGHHQEQAEQLSLIVHLKGKANVKSASYIALRPFRDALAERGLSVVIEEVYDKA